jgi:hypothetical protein
MKPALTLAAVVGLARLAGMTAGASTASAAIVCNRDHVCWHVHDNYTYPPSVGVHVYGDDWKWRAHQHYRWHEHTGRGYWKGGVWITL